MSIQRLILAAIILTLAAVTFIQINAEPLGRIFWHLLTVHDLPAGWLMVAIIAAGYALAFRAGAPCAWLERLPVELDRRRYLVAGVLWLLLCAGSIWIYRGHPLAMDEYSAVFQAKVFAAASIHGQFPPEMIDQLIPRGFQNHFLMVNRATGAVVSAYWPGFSLLLAPFVWLGIPWACNPTLVTASFLLIGRMARQLGGSPFAAGWAMLFALASPAFVVNGIAYYSMPAHLLCNLGYAWLLLVPSPRRLFLAGLLGGFALALHNPFPHATFAIPWIVWLATRKERRLRNLGLLVAGYLPTFLILVVGWSLWQRDVLHAAAAAVVAEGAAKAAAPGLADRVWGLVQGFSRMMQWPDELIVYARLGGLAKLWLWASPLLLLLAWWGGRENKHSGVRLLGASALLTFFAYFTIRFDQGHGWGYRYFHSAWGALPILAALGIGKLAWAENAPIVTRQMGAICLMSLVGANALRFTQVGEFMETHLAHFPPRVESQRTIYVHNWRGYYAADLIQNDPWLRGPQVVFSEELAADYKMVETYFPTAREVANNRYGRTYIDGGTSRLP